MQGTHPTQLNDGRMEVPEQRYHKNIFEILRIPREVIEVFDDSAEQENPEEADCSACNLHFPRPACAELPE